MSYISINFNIMTKGDEWFSGDLFCDSCKSSFGELGIYYYMNFDGVGDMFCGKCMKKELQHCIDLIVE